LLGIWIEKVRTASQVREMANLQQDYSRREKLLPGIELFLGNANILKEEICQGIPAGNDHRKREQRFDDAMTESWPTYFRDRVAERRTQASTTTSRWHQP